MQGELIRAHVRALFDETPEISHGQVSTLFQDKYGYPIQPKALEFNNLRKFLMTVAGIKCFRREDRSRVWRLMSTDVGSASEVRILWMAARKACEATMTTVVEDAAWTADARLLRHREGEARKLLPFWQRTPRPRKGDDAERPSTRWC